MSRAPQAKKKSGMTKHHATQLTQLLATLAVALSIASLAIVATVALRTGVVHWAVFTPSFIVLLGAGRRLSKSRAKAKTSADAA